MSLTGCTEKAWQMTVVSAAAHLGWECYHTYFSLRSHPGYPDLTLVHPVHGVVWMELKRQKGLVTEAQEQWINLLQTAGQRAGVFRPNDWDVVERILKGEPRALRGMKLGTVPEEGSMDYFLMELRDIKAVMPHLTMDQIDDAFWAAYERLREMKGEDNAE